MLIDIVKKMPATNGAENNKNVPIIKVINPNSVGFITAKFNFKFIALFIFKQSFIN